MTSVGPLHQAESFAEELCSRRVSAPPPGHKQRFHLLQEPYGQIPDVEAPILDVY
jgi:hypothetical protein